MAAFRQDYCLVGSAGKRETNLTDDLYIRANWLHRDSIGIIAWPRHRPVLFTKAQISNRQQLHCGV